MAWSVVFVSGYVAHIYDRHLRRLVLSRVPRIPRSKSSAYDLSSRAGAKAKAAELRRLQEVLDNKYISSALQNIFNLGKVLRTEKQIIELFEEAKKDELNIILQNAELGHIFYKIKDHKFVRRFNRTKLLQLLSVDRLNDLNVTARAMLLDGFQKMKLSAHSESDSYVRNIICSTKGDKLSELKTLSDSKGDINSFHKLIYRDVENHVEKQTILDHIEKQARVQQAHSMIGSRTGKQRGQMAWRKIISDVDDTLTCSGGSWPAGLDTSYPRKVLYPGVLAFYRELDLGTGGKEEWDPLTQVGNLVFLSARPHVYKEVSEAHSYAKFRDLQEKRGLYTNPTLLAGSLATGGNFMFGKTSEPLAEKKFENFKEYQALYPEFSYILLGDNGQGDVRTSEMIMTEESLRNHLLRTYIHQVQPLQKTHTVNRETRQKTNRNICYFKTYIEAAVDAHKHKLIRLSGLRKIMCEAIKDFRSIGDESWKAADELPLTVTTQVKAEKGTSSEGENDKKSKQLTLSAKRAKASIIPVYNPELKVDARMRELNLALYQGNIVLAEGNIEPVPLMRFKRRFMNGGVVKTAFGVGVVARFRDTDGVYEILMQWDASGEKTPIKAYFQGSAMKLIPPPLNPSAQVRRFRANVAPKVSLRTAIPTRLVPKYLKKKDIDGLSSSLSSFSNRSSPATVSIQSKTDNSKSLVDSASSTSNLTVAAVARHTIIAGQSKQGLDEKDAKPKPEDDLEVALEMAFVPSALARATGRHEHANNINTSSQNFTSRARTLSTSSDDRVSSFTGRVRDPNDRLVNSRGGRAWTPYGLGFIEDYREKDDIVVVNLDFGAKAYIGRLNVVQLTEPQHTLAYQRLLDQEDEARLLSGDTESLIHGTGSDHTLPLYHNESIGEDSKEKVEDINDNAASKKDKRPSMFPSWMDIWGSSTGNDKNKMDANNLDSNDGFSKRRIIYPKELTNSNVTTSFGPAKITAILIEATNEEEQKPAANNVIIQVDLLSWGLCHYNGDDPKFAQGYLAPSAIFVCKQSLPAGTKIPSILEPIEEENIQVSFHSQNNSTVHNSSDENLISLSSDPAFLRVVNKL